MEPSEEPAKPAQVKEIDEAARRTLHDQAESMAPGSEPETSERIERSEVDGPDLARVTREVRPGPRRERQIRALAAIDDADGVGGLDGA